MIAHYYSCIVAQFEQTNLENIDGMLEVRWTLRHTGGLPLLSISVTCNGDNRLSNMSLCSVGTCGTRDGSTRLGPVEAGNNYTCTVTASNVLGSTPSDTNAVIALTGETMEMIMTALLYCFCRYPIHSTDVSTVYYWSDGEATDYHCLYWSTSRRH